MVSMAAPPGTESINIFEFFLALHGLIYICFYTFLFLTGYSYCPTIFIKYGVPDPLQQC